MCQSIHIMIQSDDGVRPRGCVDAREKPTINSLAAMFENNEEVSSSYFGQVFKQNSSTSHKSQRGGQGKQNC